MGKLYCVCREASEKKCKGCLKNKIIKPDHIIKAEGWPLRLFN